MIPDDLPRARVFTYSHDAVALARTSANSSNISEHARHLLERLANARKDCPERPMLFVAHGMNGIIVKEVSDRMHVLYNYLIEEKQALRIAKHDRTYFGVYRATRGIVFLGASKNTPFQRLSEETPSQLKSNDVPTLPPVAPIKVGCFKASAVPNPSAAVVRTEVCKGQDCPARILPPDLTASSRIDQSFSSSKVTALAAPHPATPIRNSLRKPDSEVIALWAAVIKRFYDMIITNSGLESGTTKLDTCKLEISCC